MYIVVLVKEVDMSGTSLFGLGPNEKKLLVVIPVPARKSCRSPSSPVQKKNLVPVPVKKNFGPGARTTLPISRKKIRFEDSSRYIRRTWNSIVPEYDQGKGRSLYPVNPNTMFSSSKRAVFWICECQTSKYTTTQKINLWVLYHLDLMVIFTCYLLLVYMIHQIRLHLVLSMARLQILILWEQSRMWEYHPIWISLYYTT
jgi:hypothetical protein